MTIRLSDLINQNRAAACDRPSLGYTVRGGGEMRDGTQPRRMLARPDGDCGFVSCPTDTSGLSGSGRSGSVRFRANRDGIYAVDEIRGSVRRQNQATAFYCRSAGQWYHLADWETAVELLGLNLDLVAQRRDERLAESSSVGDYDGEEV